MNNNIHHEYTDLNHRLSNQPWPLVRLGDVCDVIGGGTPSKENKTFYQGNIPWATVRDMRNDFVNTTEHKITEQAVKSSSTNIIPGGNVIIATRVGLGKICILSMDTAINQDLRGIVPKNINTLEVKYLFYWFRSIADEIINEGTGATVQGVKLPFIKGLLIPLPPLAEQQRIVARLDAAFAAIAEASAAAEANLRNARALFDSYLDQVFSTRGAGWVERRLGDVCESISTGPFGTMLHKTDYIVEGIPVVNPMNIIDGRIVPSSKMMISDAKRDELKSYVLSVGDVVIARRGELGRCAVVTETEAGWLCGTGSFFLKLKKNIHPLFFTMYFGSEKLKKELQASSVGTTMDSLNHTILNNIVIPIPPYLVQETIVNTAGDIKENIDDVTSIYTNKLAALTELKQALLAEVFGAA